MLSSSGYIMVGGADERLTTYANEGRVAEDPRRSQMAHERNFQRDDQAQNRQSRPRTVLS
jgi:hypothetical protein